MNCIYCHNPCKQIYGKNACCEICLVLYSIGYTSNFIIMPFSDDDYHHSIKQKSSLIDMIIIYPDSNTIIASSWCGDKSFKLDKKWVFPYNILDILKECNKWSAFI